METHEVIELSIYCYKCCEIWEAEGRWCGEKFELRLLNVKFIRELRRCR